MFARPVDPFLSYNPTFPSTEARHKDMFTQTQRLQQQQHQPYHIKDDRRQTDQAQSQRRKRSFHFEPEFITALDASLHEPSRLVRPSKKPRHTTAIQPPTIAASTSTTTVSNQEPKPSIHSPRKSSGKISKGPSIIDLSSGEELAALHLGDNEHKRPRESDADSGSSSELREVYDVLEDGTLCPIMDHAPAKPSPTKRMRVEKPMRSKLKTLDQDTERKPLLVDTLRIRRTAQSKDKVSRVLRTDKGTSNHQEGLSQMEMSVEDESSKTMPSTPIAERGALVRYEGPKSMTLADGVEGLLRYRWRESQRELPTLTNVQGNELVLYRRPPPAFLTSQDDDIYDCVTHIEELDDDDTSRNTPDSYNENGIRELEEKIMGMDLD